MRSGGLQLSSVRCANENSCFILGDTKLEARQQSIEYCMDDHTSHRSALRPCSRTLYPYLYIEVDASLSTPIRSPSVTALETTARPMPTGRIQRGASPKTFLS